MWEYYGLNELFSRKTATTSPANILSSTQQAQRQVVLDNLFNNYTYTSNLTEEHYYTIKDLKGEEELRLSSIESKLGQIITQSGLIFSLVSLIAPIFKDSLSDLSLVIKIIIILCYFISFLAFLFSILMASGIFSVHKFVYVRQNSASVIETPPSSKEDFLASKVKSFILEIKHNREVNNSKANLLIYANRLLITGFISSGLFSLCLCSFLLFGENKDYKQENIALDIKKQGIEILMLKEKSSELMQVSLHILDSVEKKKLQNSINLLNKKIKRIDKKVRKIKETK